MTFSALSAHAEEFLALKRAVAKADPHGNSQDHRSLKHRGKLLRSFVAYWRDQQCPWPIRFSLVLDWVAVGSDRQQPYRDQLRFYVARAFLQQIRTFEPATEIPQNIYRPLYRRRTPHLYSEDDLTRLMKAAWRLQRVTPFRRVTVHALLGLRDLRSSPEPCHLWSQELRSVAWEGSKRSLDTLVAQDRAGS